MSTWDDLVPSDSKYLKKEDVGEEGMNLTIAGFGRENVGQGSEIEERAIVRFKQDMKPMVLNKTNAERLKHIFKTDNPKEVIGNTVNVYNDPLIEFGGKIVGGIRIRKAVAKQAESGESENPGAGMPDDEFNDDIPY